MSKIEVSNGELLDKLTILELKLLKMTDENKLANVRREADLLTETAMATSAVWDLVVDVSKVRPEDSLHARLFHVNLALWEVEDKLREKERLQEFDDDFIQLARSVYLLNDERSDIKKAVNMVTQSLLCEEKSYAYYRDAQ